MSYRCIRPGLSRLDDRGLQGLKQKTVIKRGVGKGSLLEILSERMEPLARAHTQPIKTAFLYVTPDIVFVCTVVWSSINGTHYIISVALLIICPMV